MMKMPRIALFSDSYHEANGVARTTAAIEACARKRNVPLLSVHAGPETRLVHDGSIVRLDLKRSRSLSFGLEHDLRFDLAMWRYLSRVAATLRWFAPDVLHFTGPSDIGQLGALLGHRLSIPMVASWHTNLHEYASRRLPLKNKPWVEAQALRALLLFYKIPRVVLAPNRELAEVLERGTGKPTFLMSRGVDTEAFTPARRVVPNAIINIGYVGRLSVEKNVRLLQALEAELDAEGLDVRFTIVGDGSEREWLQRHMLRAEFTGVLRGDALARAYAQMDIFAFPSETDTVGNVVLEAMASGVPVVAMAGGGPRFVVEPERTAIVAADRVAFIQGVRTLVRNRERREAMGAASRARAKELMSWDRIFLDVCHAYDAAISPAEGEGQNRCVLSPA
ncbi:MAG TPA: glycosyltransferase [Vicinamibacterales bacterium]|nr:glycosyltransferase [Vicinamibacterales bacterium]